MNVAALIMAVVSATDVSITQPEDGGVYSSAVLTLSAIVQNENILPDSVTCSLNGEPFLPVPRLSTDWPTYMQSNLHQGYSAAPAPHEPTILWTAPVTGLIHEFPTPIVVNGIVYYSSNSGDLKLHALDAATGEEIWSYQTMGSDDPPSVVDGRVFLSSDSVYCIDALTGTRLWTFCSGEEEFDAGSTPCVMDGMVACAGNIWALNETYIHCLSVEDGSEVWVRQLSGRVMNCMAGWNGMFIIGNYMGPLIALDAETGETVWSNEYSEDGYWDSSPVVVDSTIYIGSFNGSVLAFDCLTGAIIWDSPIGDNITATPSYHDGSLFIGIEGIGPDGNFVRLDAATGQILWNRALSIHGSPGVADGLVFFGEMYFGTDARIIALDCATGETVWTYSVEAEMFMGSPSITDGVMYIPAIDGLLYAFGTGLKWTYTDDINAEVGENQLVADSWSGGAVVASDTVSFTVTENGIEPGPVSGFELMVLPNPFTESAALIVPDRAFGPCLGAGVRSVGPPGAFAGRSGDGRRGAFHRLGRKG